MLPILTALAGAVLGALAARRRKGSGFDIAQWAAVWAIIGGLLGLVVLILLARL
ncbi:hypothetical protein [Jannaschia ovalis]|uniref:PEP-CTERM protein-sorting domain-containing protein n=1 Tax=Jannaschia ovalis TaxID=3038773 RepID=A0ABY8L9E5_9RHOB|nr:hypothetical protein [Jannaschia sp. GRR-S6-38]WGH77978.1 hypothetical protein P8627_13185 [Jannaschia sp. GRR-S6-38]